jgi:hypothetical protein
MCVAAAIFCFAFPAVGQQSQNSVAERVASDPINNNDVKNPETIRRVRLTRMVAKITPGGTFAEAIDAMRDSTHANIFVNWRALEEVGITRDTPILLGVNYLPLHTTLDLLLMVAANGERKLGYSVVDDAIQVSTVGELAKGLYTRVYDVRDLLPTDKIERENRAVALTKLLVDTVDPSSWQVNRGQAGVIRELQGNLIITQTAENQRAITSMIENLRSVFSHLPGEGAAKQEVQQRFPLMTTQPKNADRK